MSYTRIFSISMKPELHDKLMKYCRDKDIKAAHLIQTFVKTWIKEQERLKAIEMKNIQAIM